MSSCTHRNNDSTDKNVDNQNSVIETIMSRRSVRAYEDRVVPRDTMELIAECGINAPNGMKSRCFAEGRKDQDCYENSLNNLYSSTWAHAEHALLLNHTIGNIY